VTPRPPAQLNLFSDQEDFVDVVLKQNISVSDSRLTRYDPNTAADKPDTASSDKRGRATSNTRIPSASRSRRSTGREADGPACIGCANYTALKTPAGLLQGVGVCDVQAREVQSNSRHACAIYWFHGWGRPPDAP
jgi:hypothetical protein